MAKEINQNPKRYKKTESGWTVSSVGDSPNGNPNGEIKPITLLKENPISELKPLLEVDGIIVKVGEDWLVSQTTLDEIVGYQNPHWDWISNGVILVKEKGVEIGKTIPIIKINSNGFPTMGVERDLANKNAGVKEVEYIYEGDKEKGISKNLIEQINYTLKEEINRPGDTFSIFDLQLGDNSAYSVDELVISTIQEDGKFDKGKLTTFLSQIDSRLKILNDDFNMIKDVFYSGTTPKNNGIILFKKQIASTTDDTTFGGDSYLKESSNITKVEDTPKDKSIDSTQKEIETNTKNIQRDIESKTKDVQTQIDVQRTELISTQRRQTLAEQQLQADLKRQADQTTDLVKRYGNQR